MKILQIYDGDGIVGPEGSVSSVVFHLSRCLSKFGHNITVLERGQVKNPYLEKDGIRSIQINLKKLATLPYKEIKKFPTRLMRLTLDRTLLALKFNKFLKKEDFDVIHVHFPFASSILVTINRKLRDKMVYTAHVGEERKRFALDSSAPFALRFFSPDLYLMKIRNVEKNLTWEAVTRM